MNAELPRTILDTNTLISAILLPASTPALAVQHAFLKGTVLRSRATSQELLNVIVRAKFSRYQPNEVRIARVSALLAAMLNLHPSEPVHLCRDPRDDKFLELALAGEADFLVTGDADLLTLHPFHGTAILTPTQFLGR